MTPRGVGRRAISNTRAKGLVGVGPEPAVNGLEGVRDRSRSMEPVSGLATAGKLVRDQHSQASLARGHV